MNVEECFMQIIFLLKRRKILHASQKGSLQLLSAERLKENHLIGEIILLCLKSSEEVHGHQHESVFK